MLAQESPAQPSSCPSLHRPRGRARGTMHVGSFLNSLRQEDQAVSLQNWAAEEHQMKEEVAIE